MKSPDFHEFSMRPSFVEHRMVFLVAVLVALCGGCAKRPGLDPSESTPASSADATPAAVVSDQPSTTQQAVERSPLPAESLAWAANYQNAQAYTGRALLRLSHLLDDGRVEQSETEVVTRFQRPNQLQIRVSSEENQVEITSDGKQLSARITDPITGNFDDQLVLREAPATISVSHLYQVTELVDPIAPQEMLSALLGVPASLDVLPIGLLLQDGKLTELVSASVPHFSAGTQRLPSGELCEVVEAASAEGNYRFWTHDGLLRRMEFPPLTENLLPGVREMSLTVDITRAAYTAGGDFRVPDSGTQVRHFVLPPIPPATDLIGKSISALRFRNRSRQEVQVKNSDGQITVLIWFRNRPESQLVLESIEQVRRRNRSDRVRFAAVAAEPDATPELLEEWNVETAWLQDQHAVGRDILQVERAPTVVVLGPMNSLQFYEVGANPNVGADMSVVIERLLAGQDVAAATLQLVDETQRAYQQLLARAKVTGDGWVEELEAELPAAADPRHLVFEEIWSSDQIKEPGNFLIVPGKQKQIVVTEGWKQVALLDTNGKLARRIPLDLPEDEGISILRAGSNGRDLALFAAAARGGRQAFVFNFAGKLHTQYPAAPSERFAVSDILIHDVSGQSEPEFIVSWQGNGGVHGVSLEGTHRWSNQATPGIISVAAVKDPTSGNQRKPILTAGESGLLFLVDENGRTLREVRLKQVIHQLASWPGHARGFESLLGRTHNVPPEQAAYLGIASSALGGRVAHGISGDWKILWSYPLPPGIYRHQVEFPQAMTIPEVGPTWLMPGPDGSVHFLSTDGKFQDTVHIGEHIRGIAGMLDGDSPILLLATDGKVSANKVTRKSTHPSSTNRAEP